MKSIGGVDAIMITHGHCDKLRGLAAAMKTNAKAVAWIHELDQPYLHDPKRNCSIAEGTSRTTDAKTSTFEESTTTIAGHRVPPIHLPATPRAARSSGSRTTTR
ncbi:MBL fold metallo-hydrolase [Dermacoccus nishinomiyaensis]|uniref:MBL fold metallo-hydrolase n=1 Tax=Dermacoccus nishinomiyaensis TaxID=1274 RepID=UPI00119D7BC6|nr:MBL fold metallo-hydrolase [Dermacoccus nishinomiyaensis]